MAWGLGTEAPARAEAQENIEQQKDLMRRRGIQVPATAARTETWLGRQPWRNALDVLVPSIRMVFGVRSGLRSPRRLTALAIAGEAPFAVFHALRVPRAAQRPPRQETTGNLAAPACEPSSLGVFSGAMASSEVSTDCGLRRVPRSLAISKMSAAAEAARRLRQRADRSRIKSAHSMRLS